MSLPSGEAETIPDTSSVNSISSTEVHAQAEVENLLNGHGGAREDQPLLRAPVAESWSPPPGFLWIEVAIMANVFLYGFDGTITAATYAVISSDFDAANTASWLTTSYLITSTAFQPLYGRFSDIFGRRVCFLVSTATFSLGCFGCGVVGDVISLNLMRALTGFGGGGLMTMATVVNSDMIPFRNRGMYQALQNGMFGFGAICGASFGGAIADNIGWRWCFLLQVPIAAIALILGLLVIQNPVGGFEGKKGIRAIWEKVDLSGSLLLVTAISLQLVGLSLGGNELPWADIRIIGTLVGSIALFAAFQVVEVRTMAIPIIPRRMLRGSLPVLIQIANASAGLAAYAYLFMLPLFFQVVLQDSATMAGARLAIPSLATPLGGMVSGLVMSRWGKLIFLVRVGALCMVFGNLLVTSLGFEDATWKYYAFIFPANLGQGIIYPAILFTSLASFDHADHAVSASTVYLIRSLGTVWGVAITSAIVQSTLTVRLPEALGDIPDKEKVSRRVLVFSRRNFASERQNDANLNTGCGEDDEQDYAVANLDQLIEEIRHSVTALRNLPPSVQLSARLVYYDGIRIAFGVSSGFAAVAVIAACFARGNQLRSTTG